jgi:hypothetical protein
MPVFWRLEKGYPADVLLQQVTHNVAELAPNGQSSTKLVAFVFGFDFCSKYSDTPEEY